MTSHATFHYFEEPGLLHAERMITGQAVAA